MVVGVDSNRRGVGVFSNRRDVEDALHELRDSGFPMDRVSVIAQNPDNKDDIAGTEVQERVGNKADEGATVGALSGGTLGGLTGLLVGLGALAIPGIGPIMLAGSVATALATTLAGAGIGAVAGSLVGGLLGLGIPEERARAYNERVERGHYLVIVDGTNSEIAKAEAILKRRGIEDFDIYDQPNTARATDTDYVTSTTPVVTSTTPTSMQRARRAIGVFSHRQDAEAALTELRDAGFSMSQVSLIAKDGDRNNPVGGVNTQTDVGNKAGKSATAGAVTGGALGGLGGLLVGLGALAIPGVGPVIAGGAIATALATAATGGAIGAAAGGLTGGLVGLGIPEANARAYNDRINRGDYLVIVDGTEDELRRAEAILKRHSIQDFDIFDQPNTARTTDQLTSATTTPVVTSTTPTSMQRARRAIGVFSHRQDAEAALTELRDAGFSMSQVSLIAKDGDRNNPVGGVNTQTDVGNKAGKSATAGAVTGGALGGLGGLLVGLGALAIPGVGPVIAGGAIATALATAATGGAIGAAAGGLTGGLVGLGIPEANARAYNDRINRGDYLVIVDGTEDELRRAETILKRHSIQDFDIFDAGNAVRQETPVVNTPSTNYSTGINSDDPAVIIIDRRDETL